jgi:hypothetical protein
MLLRTLLILFAIGADGSVSASTQKSWNLIRPDGIGPVRIGMNLSELDAVLGETFQMPEDKDEQGCFYVDSVKHPGMSFMIEENRLTRIDIDEKHFATATGAHVDDSEAHLIALYANKLKIEPNAYEPRDHVLTFAPVHQEFGIRFIIADGKIRVIYAGRRTSISYIEGCE